jgi:peptidoglycan/LPS O-acetylase OafA/YrhL
VQGLRAIAVSVVVLYHVWPHLVPGGFVGVDVFFVISGYLITGNLARTARRTGRVQLLDFWGRRARRLLPAAALVLAVTWALSHALLPLTRLPAAAQQVRASALYMQNWVLAHDAVNYLDASNAPSPVEHFWSLSVEEQFYLCWPLLFLLGWLVTRRLRRSARAQRWLVGGLVVAVVVASLAYSAIETRTNPPAAYFITTTRAWELGLGGALALLPAGLSARLARFGWASWAGLGLVIASLFVIDRTSPFPGTIALLPTVGTAVLLLTGSGEARGSTAVLTGRRPAVFLGDISYSLYLWHWPLIVLWQSHTARTRVGVRAGLAIIALAVLLSWLTKRYVEDRVRLAPIIAAHRGRSLATALTLAVPVALVAALAPSAGTIGHIDARHPGAAVLAGAVAPPARASFVPSVTAAPNDAAPFVPCEIVNADSTPIHCHLGDTTDPALKVALVGDSVLGQWQSALNAIAKQQEWQLVTDYRASCDWSATMTAQLGTNKPYTACYDWGRNALHDLLTKTHPDVVITSGRPMFGTPRHPTPDATSFGAIARGMVAYWNQLLAAGIKVVVLDATPEMGHNVPDCLSGANGSVISCSVPRDQAVHADGPLNQAARMLAGRVESVNMNSLICSASTCKPVVGNVIVYIDTHHLTKAYTRTAEPYLADKLLATSAFGGAVRSPSAQQR